MSFLATRSLTGVVVAQAARVWPAAALPWPAALEVVAAYPLALAFAVLGRAVQVLVHHLCFDK